MTMIGNNILNQIVHDQEIYAPNEILNQMPILLKKTLQHSEGKVKDGMDIALITFENCMNLSNQQGISISYAGAMNPLYYVQHGELKEIKANKKPIDERAKSEFSYQKHTLELGNQKSLHGLTLYLSSDGFQDQFGGEQNKKFMVKKLKNLLLEISEKPLAAQKQHIENTFDAWKGNQKQTDDVLLIGIKF
jgi:serine phosphatase RsbU (regulator of sigma subunit)